MKKVLVTGAAGTIGLQTICFLLNEGKYEITALELRNKRSYKRLKKYRKKINIVYGDVNDVSLVDSLVKTHDVVIHLAGVLPPFANVKEDLCKTVDYDGTVNIVKAIKNYNPKCYLLYASSTSIYGKSNKELNVSSKCCYDTYDYYSKYKVKAEKYIKDHINNYSIFRLAFILGDPGPDSLIYNLGPKERLEALSSEDAGYAFSCAIEFLNKLNKKTFNVSGGENFRTTYGEYILHILKSYGVSVRFLSTFMLAEKNYCVGYYEDSDDLNDILHFRNKKFDSYYDTLLKYKGKIGRLIPRLLAIPFILYFKFNREKNIDKKL